MEDELKDITLLTPNQVAEATGIRIGTLKKWRLERTNLPFIHVGRSVRYRLSDVEDYLASRTVPVERV